MDVLGGQKRNDGDPPATLALEPRPTMN